MNKMLPALAFVVIAALSATPARSATLADVCGRFNDGGNILRCVQAADGRYTDPKALDVCNRFSHGDNIFQCIRAVAGRSYQPSDIALCNRFQDGANVLRCMADAGRPYNSERDAREAMRELVATCKALFSNDSDRLSCIEAGLRPAKVE